MSSDFFSKKIFEQIQAMEKEGNINLLMAEMVRNHDRLNLVWPELMEKVALYLERFSSLISTDTIACLKSLPSALKHPGLRKQLRLFSGEPTPPLCGRIFFPVVGATGQIEELMVSERGPGSLSSPRLEMLDQVGAPVFSALREATRLPLFWDPEEFSFQILDTFGKEDSAVAGESMGLPLALALYSFMTKKELPPNLSATAMVRRNGMVEPVERLKEKLTALKRERHFIEKVFISKRQKVNFRIRALKLVRVDRLKDAVNDIFPGPVDPSLLPARIDVDAVISMIEKQYSNYLIDTCMENALKLTRYLKARGCPITGDKAIKALFVCYWRRGSCHCHKGEVAETKRCLEKAKQLQKKHPGIIKVNDHLNAMINQAVLLKDLFRYEQAQALHEHINQQTRQIPGLDNIKAKNLSSLSQLWLAKSRFGEAESNQSAAIKLFWESRDQLSRNYGYLTQIYARWCKWQKAKNALKKATSHLCFVPAEKRQTHQYFLQCIESELLYRKSLHLKRPPKTLYQEINRIVSTCHEIAHYAKGLTVKYCGLALLNKGTDDFGLELLSKSIEYFEQDFNLMFHLLAASVRVERAFYFFNKQQSEKATGDIERIIKTLSLKPFKYYFKDNTRELGRYLRLKRPLEKHNATAVKCLRSIQNEIPY